MGEASNPLKIDWEIVPLWPFYLVLYVVTGCVVAESMSVASRRACAASSPIPLETKLLVGGLWPLTAPVMMVLYVDPFAALTADPNEPPNT